MSSDVVSKSSSKLLADDFYVKVLSGLRQSCWFKTELPTMLSLFNSGQDSHRIQDIETVTNGEVRTQREKSQ